MSAPGVRRLAHGAAPGVGSLCPQWHGSQHSVCITLSASRDTLRGVKTLRLDAELEERLQHAAAAAGESLSEFIRQAATERADTVLSTGGREDFADVLGVIHGGGGQARRTGEAFGELLAERKRSA